MCSVISAIRKKVEATQCHFPPQVAHHAEDTVILWMDKAGICIFMALFFFWP